MPQRERNLLDRLVGRWRLTGHMGNVALSQNVTADWMLGGTFVVMYCRSTAPEDNPTAGYEAVYHLGFNRETHQFVMHLLDTTEVPTACVVGLGRRDGHRIPFLFQYGDTPFTNTFSWDAEQDRWTFLQTYEEDGEAKVFATKEMVRVP